MHERHGKTDRKNTSQRKGGESRRKANRRTSVEETEAGGGSGRRREKERERKKLRKRERARKRASRERHE